jgi:CheY-like chemotaxis protein
MIFVIAFTRGGGMRSELDLPDLSRLTLLAVDDNADALEVLGTILKACGAQVLEARHAQDALAYVDTTPRLDAIITDLSMPGMDGVELARRVRQQPSRHGLPVIALTGFPERYVDTSAFDAFLKKPFDFDELCRTVDALTAARDGRP